MKLKELYKALNITDSEYEEIKKQIGREPNELEVYLFSAMWSEHCGYKHSRKYLGDLPKTGSIGADENAGGIVIGDHVVAFKVESHNHPSAIEPFQGAATGIGGIIRDIIAVGARPIALLDSLKFGSLKDSTVKHLLDGVVRGISAYGNSIGVPTVAGEVAFDDSYTSSPLVNVMAVGIVKKDEIKSAKAYPGGVVVLTGSHTGRDGIHGASFASKELSEESKKDRPSVQVGDPFMEKIVIEANLEILNIKEVLSCQDCGAAGLLSSTSEMADKGKCGINLYLDKVHLREEAMQPWEIMLSESQERMVYVVTPEGVDKVLAIADKYDIPASVIGETTDSGMYKLFWYGEEVASLPPKSLCNGPMYTLNEIEPEYIQEFREKTLTEKIPIEKVVETLVGDPNFASKNWVFSQYDHTVGTRTALKPAESGAAAIWLREEGGMLGVTIDSNGRQVFLDPFNGAKNTVWEAYRNLVSSGFEPMAVTNCLNFGNPEKDEVSYQFVNTIKGMSEACVEANIPVVSGNVSFYNECPDHRVYPTPAIGIIGYTPKPENIIPSSFNKDETVFLIGNQINDDSTIGGSLYQKAVYNFIGGAVDKVDAELEKKLKEVIFELKNQTAISGCNDVSEGGLFGAVFEGLKTGNVGFKGNLIHCTDQEKALFGEITGRYVLSTNKPETAVNIFKEKNIPFTELGICTVEKRIIFNEYNFEADKLFSLYDTVIENEMENEA